MVIGPSLSWLLIGWFPSLTLQWATRMHLIPFNLHHHPVKCFMHCCVTFFIPRLRTPNWLWIRNGRSSWRSSWRSSGCSDFIVCSYNPSWPSRSFFPMLIFSLSHLALAQGGLRVFSCTHKEPSRLDLFTVTLQSIHVSQFLCMHTY